MLPSEPPPRATILVVDDAPDQVALLVDLLKGLYRVQVATTGSKALGLIDGGSRPDLLLLDVMLPDMEGFELCRDLKGRPETREIPILFLTAKSELADEARGFAAGAADYITKPFSAALVLARVRTHLEQRRLLDAERSLLEQTLKSAMAVILEMLSMSDPLAWPWNQRLAELAEKVARQLGHAEPWMVSLAAVLSRVGTLAVPEPVLVKVRAKSLLNSEEREAYQRIPEIGFQLLRKIPRLEEVAEMVHYAQKNFNGTGFPKDGLAGEDIPIGARILRVCTDFLPAEPSRDDPRKRVLEMLTRISSYDTEVLFALKDVVEEGFFDDLAAPAEAEDRSLSISELREGMVLAESVDTHEGQVLLRAGTELKAAHIEKLANFALIGAIPGQVQVK